MQEIVDAINGVIWNQWFIYGIVAVGAFFTIAFGGLQVRNFGAMVRELRESATTDTGTGIKPLQALLISLSARLGTGNIAGVATAIAMGGPGAVVWMWIAAALGMATAFAEGALAQVYKERKGNEFRGGPGFYLSKGTGKEFLGLIYAVCIFLAYTVFVPGIQVNAITQTAFHAWNIPLWVVDVVVVALMILISAGGVRRFANFSQAAVPFMAGAYVLAALVLLIANIGEIPHMFGLMFSSAFGQDAVFGGMIGAAISWGVKRGVYSNEAGQGTAAHAAAAANTSHPAKQGLIQSLGVFIDTWILCSTTAFMILVTNSYNVIGADGQTVVEYLPGVQPGAAYPQAAVDSLVPGFGSSFVAIIVFFFAFTTLLYYVFAGEINAHRLFGEKKFLRWVVVGTIAVMSLYGGVAESTLVWAIGDIGVGLMTWVNMIGLVILTPVVRKVIQDYRRQRNAGLDPVFDPVALGIKNATYWEEIRKSEAAVK